MVGACVIMALFALLIIRGYWLALHARDRFGTLLVVGITSLLAFQTFFNIGVVTGFLPPTGISAFPDRSPPPRRNRRKRGPRESGPLSFRGERTSSEISGLSPGGGSERMELVRTI